MSELEPPISIEEFKSLDPSQRIVISDKEDPEVEKHTFADVVATVEEKDFADNGSIVGVLSDDTGEIIFRLPPSHVDKDKFILKVGKTYDFYRVQRVFNNGEQELLIRGAWSEIQESISTHCEDCGYGLDKSNIVKGGSPEYGWRYVECPECNSKYPQSFLD